MNKKIYIIFLFFWSCSGLKEDSDLLDSIYYIEDGWIAFTEGDYIQATNLFETALLNDEPIYNLMSYTGLGWTKTYQSRSLLFQVEQDSINTIRDYAGENFINAYLILPELLLDTISMSESIKIQFNNHYIGAIAGRAFHYYMLAKQAYVNNESWNQSDSLYNLFIDFSDDLILIDSEFMFLYDSELDINDFYIYRAQIYFLLGLTELAMAEFEKTPYDCSNSNTFLECISLLGCTDPVAINYNPNAVTDDGSCIY